jgi:putative membrane protein
VFVAIASTVGYVLAFWGFTLTRHSAGTLHITRGLITSRATSIEERRLRGVELSAPFSLRAVGGARCIAIATGLRVGRGAERGGSLLLPPAPEAEAERVATDVLRTAAPIKATLVAHGPRATRRRYTRALSVVVILILLVLAARWLLDAPDWAWQAALVLIPIGLALAVDRARQLGHALVDGWLVTQQGSLVRRRSTLAGDGIIGWNVSRSFFQRRAGLATLTATTAAGRQHFEVLDVELGRAIGLADATTPGLLTPFLQR